MISRRGFLGMSATGAALAMRPRSFNMELWTQAAAPATPATILLNSNENAYGPSPRVLDIARQALAKAMRYADAEFENLVSAIAARHQVAREQVLVGCGSTDLLRMAAEAFGSAGRRVVMAAPSFEAVGYYAAARGGHLVNVPLTSTFAHDAERMLAAATGTAGLIYLCNPNNPTGSLTPVAEVRRLLEKFPPGYAIVVDEAYHEFAEGAPEYQSVIGHPRAIVLRTFSKIHALAGLRLGYAIASREQIAALRRFELFDSANIVAASCALASLADAAHLALAARRNAADRAEFLRQAAARGLQSVPSHTNFVMLAANRPVQQVIAHFAANNVRVGRPFPPMDTFVRVSLGLPHEMNAFWRAWDRLPAASAREQA